MKSKADARMPPTNTMNRASKGAKTDLDAPAARATGPIRMLRLAQIIERTELRKTTIYKLQKAGRFPKSVHLTEHSVRWIETEVDAWLAARAASRPFAANR